MCQDTRTRMCVLRLPAGRQFEPTPRPSNPFAPLLFLHILICVKLLLKCKTHCAPGDISTHSGHAITGSFPMSLFSGLPSAPSAPSASTLFLFSFCCLVNTVLCFCVHVCVCVCEGLLFLLSSYCGITKTRPNKGGKWRKCGEKAG